MTDTYREVGYAAHEHGFGTRPAVLAVDWQTAFTQPKYALGGLERLHAAVENTAPLLQAARRIGVPVASCYTAYCSQDDMPLWKVDVVRKEFLYGHPCTEMDSRIFEPDYDFNFCKNAPSMFFHTPLITFLAKQQVDTLIVTGCTTSGCVRATIVDGFSYGFRMAVVADCCGDAEARPHEDTLRDVGRRYCDITDSRTVLDYFETLPGSHAQRAAG